MGTRIWLIAIVAGCLAILPAAIFAIWTVRGGVPSSTLAHTALELRPVGLLHEMESGVAPRPETLDRASRHLALWRLTHASLQDGPLRVALGDVVSALSHLMEATEDEEPDQVMQATRDARAALFRLDVARDVVLAQTLSQGPTAAVLAKSVGAGAFIFVTIGLFLIAFSRRETGHTRGVPSIDPHVEKLAYSDALTGIANRTRFFDALACALTTSREVTVCLFDLDQFRELNERRGRALGDAILREMAKRLSSAAATEDGVVARLGRDDFAVLLPFDDPERIAAFLDCVVGKCSQPIAKGGDIVTPSFSIGVASASRLASDTPATHEAMIRLADFALNAARVKDETRSIAIYDAEMESNFVDRKTMVEELPRALADGAVEVYLQPKVNLHTLEVVGFEALVRWTRCGVPVPPADLIRTAEDSGLILDVDRYMLDQAIGLIADWNRRHKTAYALSVNVSARHLLQDDVVQAVSNSLTRHSLQPELLTIEITETMELGNWEKAGVILSRLRDVRCRIAIDDFGIGYSSLAYLRAIAADELKIDKSLIDDIESGETLLILEAVLQLTRQLGLSVVVEGIERDTQADILAASGFTLGQGYLLGRPRPALDWLADVTYGISEGTERPDPLPKVLEPLVSDT